MHAQPPCRVLSFVPLDGSVCVQEAGFSLVTEMYFSTSVKCILCVILYIKMYAFSYTEGSVPLDCPQLLVPATKWWEP